MGSDSRAYKYLDLLTAAFVALLLITCTVASKIFAPVAGMTFNGGALFIPFNYLCGCILTEVYGYARTRRVIWTGFLAAAFMSLGYWVVGLIPAAPTWPYQAAYDSILGVVPRIVTASLIAYFFGEFTNSFVVAKMKILTQGKHLWTRTVGATLASQAVDTTVFVVIAFYGTQAFGLILSLSVSIYLLKVMIEIVATPLVYRITSFLKRAEGEDYFDVGTNFNPFALFRETR
ncbi:MAG TPA: queuosine precursor transporter [Terriglobia bacterium]|nr:queuosine precursor transporter [Terriglobia bacterium]